MQNGVNRIKQAKSQRRCATPFFVLHVHNVNPISIHSPGSIMCGHECKKHLSASSEYRYRCVCVCPPLSFSTHMGVFFAPGQTIAE